MNISGLNFALEVNGLSDVSVAEFRLEEGLSQLFILTLTVVSSDPAIDMKSLLLKQASFAVHANGGVQRTVSGIISSAIKGKSGFRRTFYTLTIRPELWRLTLKKDSRIFHFKSVPEIIDLLLAEHDVRVENKLLDTHKSREYVTQKRETDYEFLCRLAAEEGISFWFESDEGDSGKLFYSDSRLGCRASLAMVYNTHPQAASTGNLMTELSYGAQMMPTQTLFKDRTYLNPNYPLQHEGEGQSDQPQHSVFDSYGRFQDDDAGKPFTQYRLEALRRESEVGFGKSNCFAVMPGNMFQLTEHPDATLNSRWQVVSVSHHGLLPQVLAEESDGKAASVVNEFKFVSSMTEWRPDFIHKPLADGPEVAEVTGPEGEEIYTNDLGSVKVHFHWNRYDNDDDKSSCWVRVAQGWNGDGFGFSAIPRIGQEVIITYLDGDIDRPLVTGCVYNGRNRPPLNLPAEKTRTTFKTKTHKGEGFNELRFEDEKDKEQIFIHAQKDMQIKVLNSKDERVEFNRTTSIGNDEEMVVANNFKVTVEGQQDQKTTGNFLALIEGDNNLSVKGDLVQKVDGSAGLSVSGDLTLQSDSKITLRVGSSFVVIHSGGVDIKGAAINLNGGGSPGDVALPANPSILSAAAALGMPFVAHCPYANMQEDE